MVGHQIFQHSFRIQINSASIAQLETIGLLSPLSSLLEENFPSPLGSLGGAVICTLLVVSFQWGCPWVSLVPTVLPLCGRQWARSQSLWRRAESHSEGRTSGSPRPPAGAHGLSQATLLACGRGASLSQQGQSEAWFPRAKGRSNSSVVHPSRLHLVTLVLF